MDAVKPTSRVKAFTWMWDVTSIADKRIIDHNQQGINSRFYKPGPFQEMEAIISEFVDWYLKELKGDD